MKKQLAAILCMAFITILACKKDPVTTDTVYFSKVKTIVQTNCVQCHQPGGAGLPVILVSDDDITSRYASIKASVIDPISFSNKRMPQGNELSQADKDVIQKWFDKGGKKTD
jgi:uncharacterized membrane protein